MVSPCWHKNICAFWKFNWNEICAYVLHMCIVIKNGDIVWKQGRYYVIFSWTWSFWGSSRIGTTSEQRKWLLAVRIFNWIWLWCCFGHFLFLSLWCKHFWGSRKDQSRWKRLSQMLLVRYSLHSHGISTIKVGKVVY